MPSGFGKAGASLALIIIALIAVPIVFFATVLISGWSSPWILVLLTAIVTSYTFAGVLLIGSYKPKKNQTIGIILVSIFLVVTTLSGIHGFFKIVIGIIMIGTIIKIAMNIKKEK